MAALKPKECQAVQSSWVYAIILTCNDKLAVWYKHHPRHTPRNTWAPGVCCLYPNSTKAHYLLMKAAFSKGRAVHQILYKILPYTIVAPPNLGKCSCTTSCTIASSLNPSLFGDSVTFTAT